MVNATKLPTLVWDIEIPIGADWPGLAFPIFNADGSPANLAGCSAAGAIRPNPRSPELYFSWSSTPSTGEGLIVIDAELSTITPRVLAAESARWGFTDGHYDLVLVNPAAPVGQRETRVVMGEVSASPQNTRLH